MFPKPDINPDIRLAATPSGTFYASREVFESIGDKVFYREWLLADVPQLPAGEGMVYPFSLLSGWRNEPLLLTRDASGNLHCMSNVCTHRGNILVKAPSSLAEIRCRYHGRRFTLDGRFSHMPRMEDAFNFPNEDDHLPKLAHHSFHGLHFVNFNADATLNGAFADMEKRLANMPWDKIVYSPEHSQDFLVKAHWALYVENFLEGFHIPFIHPSLSAVLDPKDYDVHCGDGFVLQTGKARNDSLGFEKDRLTMDDNVAAYYYWLFPNTMLNFYPWGISVNIINPLTPQLTKVSYRTYIWDSRWLGMGAGAAVEKVEREDQAIVEEVQTGITSHLYKKGRYSPAMEQGVHHFHRLISDGL